MRHWVGCVRRRFWYIHEPWPKAAFWRRPVILCSFRHLNWNFSAGIAAMHCVCYCRHLSIGRERRLSKKLTPTGLQGVWCEATGNPDSRRIRRTGFCWLSRWFITQSEWMPSKSTVIRMACVIHRECTRNVPPYFFLWHIYKAIYS